MRCALAVFFFTIVTTSPVFAQSDAGGGWSNLASPTLDGAKSAVTENVDIVRDRIHITLVSGAIQFMKPANGLYFAAVFHGQGKVNVDPPNPIEAQQLRLFTKQDKINLSFTDATFSFTDDLLFEVAKQVKWKESGWPTDDLYTSRQKTREDLGFSALPHVFKGIYSADRKRTAYFLADLKIDGKEWVEFTYDALSPEEINIGKYTDIGVVRFHDTWMHFPAGGRSGGEAWRDPQAMDDFIIRSFKIDASVTASAELSATTRLVLVPRWDGERVLRFVFDSNLRVDSVKNSQGKSLAFYQSQEDKDRYQSYGDYLAVMLDEPFKTGTEQTLEFHYAGKRAIRQAGNGNYFCESSGWYPERSNSFSSRADFELTFHSPKKTLLVATGEKISESTDGNTITTTWKSEIPLAVAGFAYGDYKVYNDKAGDVGVDIYANREPDEVLDSVQRLFDSHRVIGAVGALTPAAMAKTMGIEMANTVRLFSSYYGPYPYKHLSVTSLPISYSYGQGWPGLIYLWSASFLDATQRHQIGLKDGVQLTDFFRAHESSHQWWGHRVGWKSYHDQWLSEGFAEFSGNLYVQYRENMKEYTNRWKHEMELLRMRDSHNHVIESLGPIWMGHRIASSETDRGSYQNLIYSKGGYVLHMLRFQMWDSRNPDPDHLFKDMMQDYCKTFDNKAASTEDFKAIVEKHMTRAMDLDGNHKMDWFFNQYVYGTGIPQYSFHASLTSAPDGKTSVTGEIERSGVPDTWKDVIPVYARVGNNVARLGTIAVSHPKEPINFALPQKVDKLTINEFQDLFADVKQ